MKWLRFAVIALVAMMTTAQAEEVIRVLGVGNSFTRDAFTFLERISEASDSHSLVLGRAIIGGCSLERHVRHIREHEADPQTGLEYNRQWPSVHPDAPRSGKAALKEALVAQPWDIVSIQQLSRLSVDYETYEPYADELVAYIRQHAPQAEIVIHQTWAYRTDADFRRVFAKEAYDQAAMYRDSAAAYQRLAADLGLRLIPVGAAFRLAEERRPYRADPADLKTLEHPALPQDGDSLHRGWHYRGKELRNDPNHANRQGQFLGSAVWFACLTGTDVRRLDLSAIRVGGEEDRRFLLEVAQAVVAEGQRPSIQPPPPSDR